MPSRRERRRAVSHKTSKPMINVAAIRMQQFGVQFYQASLTANDIDKLVRFEVLSYGDQGQPGSGAGTGRPLRRRR